MKMAEKAELANYRWQNKPEKVQQKKFDPMKDTAIILTNNKRYTKVNEYEALLAEEDSNNAIQNFHEIFKISLNSFLLLKLFLKF